MTVEWLDQRPEPSAATYGTWLLSRILFVKCTRLGGLDSGLVLGHKIKWIARE